MARSALVPGSVKDLPLFQIRQPARANDPETSRQAAREIQTSGKLTEQCEETLLALARYQWATGKAPTSHELAGDDTEKRYLYARRLPDLAKHKHVQQLSSKRPCAITKRAAFPWEVTEAGMAEFRRIRSRREEARGCE